MRLISKSLQPVPMPEADRGEELSIAYVSAIAAHAGVSIAEILRRDYGIDMTFRRLWKRTSDNHYSDRSGISVPSQLKSARVPEWEMRGERIVYALKAKNYNDLVTSTNGFLILMCLPSAIDQWLKQDEECLRLHKCYYYWRTELEDEETTNTKTKTIYIPRDQLFTPAALISLVDEAQPGRAL